jgi:hypothetical protein
VLHHAVGASVIMFMEQHSLKMLAAQFAEASMNVMWEYIWSNQLVTIDITPHV